MDGNSFKNGICNRRNKRRIEGNIIVCEVC